MSSPNTHPYVYFSHTMVFADRQTYSEIENADFLKNEFLWMEKRTTVVDGGATSWTGLFLYGDNTFMEFLDPEATPWKSPDGLALAVEEPGGSLHVERNLRAALALSVNRTLRTRMHEGVALPWFYSANFERSNDSRISTWVMEFHPDFLTRWRPELPPKVGGTARRDEYQRYRAAIGETPQSAKRYFKDVVEVSLGLSTEEKELLTGELEAYGYRIESGPVATRCLGPGIQFLIIPAAAQQAGILSCKLQLYRQKTGQDVYQFGTRSILHFHPDQTATWTFK